MRDTMETAAILEKAPAGTGARRVARNALFLAAGHVLSKAANFAFVVCFLKLLGEEELGKFGVVMCAVLILDTLVDFGLNGHSLCRLSRSPGEARHVLSNVLAVKTVLAALSVPALALIVARLPYPPLLRLALLFCPVVVLLHAWGSTLEVIFPAVERMEFRSFQGILGSLSFAALGILCCALTRTFLAAVFVSIAIGAIRTVVAYLLGRRFFGGLSLSAVDPRSWPGLLRASFPFAAILAMGVVYFRVDHLMLSGLAGLEATGIYYAVYRILEFLVAFPRMALDATFPRLVRAHAGEGGTPRIVFEKILKLFLLAAGPVALGIAFFADVIVRVLYGARLASAAPTLAVLGLSIVLFSLTSLTSNYLASAGRARVVAWALVATLAVNVAGNALLIPRWGPFGAAVATLVTEAVFLAGQLAYLLATSLPARALVVAAKPLAGLAIAAGCLGALAGQGRLVAAATASVAYVAFHLAARTLGPDDRALLLRAAGRAP